MFITVYDTEDLFFYFFIFTTAGKDVFSTDEFRRFAQDRRSTEVNETVAQFTDGRVGSQARCRVGTTAFGTDDEFAHIAFFTAQHASFLYHFLGIADSFVNGFQRAAFFLDDNLFERFIRPFLDSLDYQVHLTVFAAQRNDDRTIHIRVGSIAGFYVHGKLLVRRYLGTAILVVEGNGAINLRSNDAGRIRSTDTGRQN